MFVQATKSSGSDGTKDCSGIESPRALLFHAREGAEAPAVEIADLRGGELVEVRGGHAEAVRQADTQALSAWRDGWLVFDNTPLRDALAEINSYRSRPITSSDARTDDSVGLVALLPRILPLTAVPQADGSVALQAR